MSYPQEVKKLKKHSAFNKMFCSSQGLAGKKRHN